ncbi:hypothetical protein AVEN_269573-1 [Araneus ventricosus]|uniref:Uncharacterized protein n=1 Tax=Araneus ventricosus TaxID=182803 RepID=A0A4Y2CC09_ARAVE|nr:hypothetical protein AVEN_269573-1 [Araneus ventricosus]
MPCLAANVLTSLLLAVKRSPVGSIFHSRAPEKSNLPLKSKWFERCYHIMPLTEVIPGPDDSTFTMFASLLDGSHECFCRENENRAREKKVVEYFCSCFDDEFSPGPKIKHGVLNESLCFL